MKSFDDADTFYARESYSGKFSEKFADRAKAMENAGSDWVKAMEKLSGDDLKAYEQALEPFKKAYTEMDKIGDFGAKGWVKKEGSTVTDEVFEQAKKTYNEASASAEKFLTGQEKVKLSGGKEVEVSEALKKAYAESQAATKKVGAVMNHPFGMLRVEGFSNTIKHNANKFHFSAEKRVKAGGGELAMRGGSVVVGAAMTIDALARGKDKEGEPRGGYTRLLEGLAGLGLAGGGLLVGHAR